MAADSFLVGVPPQFDDPEEDLSVAAGELNALDKAPGIEYEHFGENLGDYDAILNWGTPITRDTFGGSPRLSAIALLGVGFDHHDVCACTDQGAVVFNAPDGVRRTAHSRAAKPPASSYSFPERGDWTCDSPWPRSLFWAHR